MLARWREIPRLPTVETRARLFTGARLRVVLPEVVASDLWCDGAIEPALTSLFRSLLRPGRVFVDVGAHYGYHSLLASELVGPTGRVVAFEPNRQTFALLAANLASRANVKAEPFALADVEGAAALQDYGPRHSSLCTLLPEARVPAAERASLRAATAIVPSTTLDRYADAHGMRPDVIKIDAEGAELAVLRGGTRLLERDRPVVTVETGDYDSPGAPASSLAVRFLEDHGYAAFELRADGMRAHELRERYGYDNLVFIHRSAV
jgi:FkbM family methyltransferase